MRGRHRFGRWLVRCDRGSGSVAGIGLVFFVALGLFVAAAAGACLLARASAQTAADQAALVGASVIYASGSGTQGNACEQARFAAEKNHSTLISCTVLEEDVLVQTGVSSSFAFLPLMKAAAKAGPIDCVSRNG